MYDYQMLQSKATSIVAKAKFAECEMVYFESLTIATLLLNWKAFYEL